MDAFLFTLMLFAAAAPTVLLWMSIETVISDYRRREIPNWVVVTTLIFGLAAHAMSATPVIDIAFSIFLGSIIFAAWTAIYYLRPGTLGGGDVKLVTAGAVAAGAHMQTFFVTLLVASLILVAVAYILQRMASKKGWETALSDDVKTMPANPLHNLGCPELPFGLPIAAAIAAVALQHGTVMNALEYVLG